jgi:hypothetical protein
VVSGKWEVGWSSQLSAISCQPESRTRDSGLGLKTCDLIRLPTETGSKRDLRGSLVGSR